MMTTQTERERASHRFLLRECRLLVPVAVVALLGAVDLISSGLGSLLSLPTCDAP